MYNLPYFKEHNKHKLFEFLQEYPFAFLTGSDANGQLVATQIPLVIEEREGHWYLQGHIMRNTDHHKAFSSNSKVLAVFTGPNCYVSASWYSDPHGGSTWNYMSVHCKGKIRFLSDEGLMTLMKKFTLQFENNDPNSPTIFDNLSDDYRNKMMPAIVGFEIEVSEMENVFKLSQNRDERSYRNIVSQLEKKGGMSTLVAHEMSKRTDDLFQKNEKES
jgi:transcriptional regulator